MTVLVREAESVEDYLASWKRAMRDVYWFKERRLFDYHPNQMVEEIRLKFKRLGNIHLIARIGQIEEAAGVLGVAVRNKVGTIGRWEPAVPLTQRSRGVGEALLGEAFALLRERRASKSRCVLRFPYSQSDTARWHLELYQKCGFVMERPTVVLLLANLTKVAVKPPKIADLEVVERDGFSSEDFADFTQKAYFSTPQDKAVHESDPYISNRGYVLKTLEAIKTGKMGYSPPECWRVAKLRDRIAGFIIGFMPARSNYRLAHGVIGELGVFPKFRGKGVGISLITDIFKCFRKHRCSYSLVGTPKTNTPALKLYSKTGFIPAFEQIDFHKSL